MDMKRRLGFAFVFLCALYLAVCAYFWAFQREQMFKPEAQMQTNPARVGMQYETVKIPTGQGNDRGELNAWWIPAADAAAPTLLYFHGNARNMAYNVEHALRLHNMGYQLLLLDYRGYGASTGGAPAEAQLYEDAEAAWQYLIQQRRQDPHQIYLYGHSLGGALAINLTTHHPEAAGLIVESTFTSMQAMGERDFGFLPIRLLLNQHFDSLQKIAKIQIPSLFIHGTWDKKIPYQMSQQLFEQAPQPKTLKLIEGGEHGNNSGIALLEYREAVMQFTQPNKEKK
jgi:uncharacterized protein